MERQEKVSFENYDHVELTYLYYNGSGDPPEYVPDADLYFPFYAFLNKRKSTDHNKKGSRHGCLSRLYQLFHPYHVIEAAEFFAAVAETTHFPETHVGMKFCAIVCQIFIIDFRHTNASIDLGNAFGA